MRLWTRVDVTNPDEVDAALIATEVLDALSGRRWTGPVRVTEEYQLGNGRLSEVTLRRTPVLAVETVKINRQFVNTSTLQLLDRKTLRAESCFPPCAVLSVTYTAGVAPPYGARRAARILTNELMAARVAPDRCTLPDRVTSISRQGVSYTILDPQDFLDNGRTGLYEIDLWLRSINPDKAHARARVIRSDVPRGRVVTPLSGRGSDLGATEYDLRLVANAELALSFMWQSDGVANAIAPQWTAIADITPYDGGAVVSLAPYLVVEPAGTIGRIDLTIPGSVTATLPLGRWRLDLVRVGDPLDLHRLVYGDVERA